MGKYFLEIEVPIYKTDANQLLGVNKFSKYKIFSQIKTDVLNECWGKRPEKPLANFKLSITRHSPRTLDYDNLIGSFKAYVDGLRLAGIIEDDSWKFIKHIDVDQVVSKEKKIVLQVRGE